MRVSCQTIALQTGSPLLRFHTTAVSRWLAIPSAAMSAFEAPAWATASQSTSWHLAQISFGSCSTQPGFG